MTPSSHRLARAGLLNVHGERSRLSREQLSRWQGLPMNWVDACDSVRTSNIRITRPKLALLDAGSARADIRRCGRSTTLDIAAGAMGLFSPSDSGCSEWQCRGARRILLEMDVSLLAQGGGADDGLLATPLRQNLEFYDAGLMTVLRQMVCEVAGGCPNGALYAESLSLSIALHLFRSHGARPLAPERGKLSPLQMRKLDELIASNLAGALALGELAAAAGFSKPHFVRLFRNTVGTSPHQHVLHKRVEQARRLLQTTALPLVVVAMETGFASQSHLNAVFVRTYGVTPGKARRRMGSTAPVAAPLD